uniref:DUF4283 domain-containing protein n=1 Tax=Nelumbo nucifera TaxID=4432 RepID=A0A822ZUN0_NELNU|nr:TPA_asm: hypothetical protein HUJ06_018187 [Nelumbo nucifera]
MNNAILDFTTNMFRENFLSSFEKDQVVDHGPWIFDDDLVVLHNGEADKCPSDYVYDHADLGIQIWGLPVEYLNAKRIASKLGKPYKPSRKWSKYACAQVSIDITEAHA